MSVLRGETNVESVTTAGLHPAAAPAERSHRQRRLMTLRQTVQVEREMRLLRRQVTAAETAVRVYYLGAALDDGKRATTQ